MTAMSVFVFQQFARLAGRIGVHEFERALLHVEVAEREGGGRVDVFVVVDDHYPPYVAGARCRGRRDARRRIPDRLDRPWSSRGVIGGGMCASPGFLGVLES
jgi:hypothetical protein